MPAQSSSSQPTPLTTQQRLHKFHTTNLQIAEIKKNVARIIEQLHAQHSWLTHTAYFWGQTPTLLKWLLGITLFCSLLVAGIWIPMNILIAASCVGSIIYLGVSLLLDNHYRHETDARNQLKNEIEPLTNILGDMVSILIELQQQLAQEIDRLEQNITHFEQHLLTLTTQLENINLESEQLGMTSEALRQTNSNLRQTQLDLAQKIHQLNLQVHTINEENTKFKDSNTTLKSTLAILAEELKGNDEQQREFVQQFNYLLHDESTGFQGALAKLYTSEKELTRVKIKLTQCNQNYCKLLTRHEKILKKDERLHNQFKTIFTNKTVKKNSLQRNKSQHTKLSHFFAGKPSTNKIKHRLRIKKTGIANINNKGT